MRHLRATWLAAAAILALAGCASTAGPAAPAPTASEPGAGNPNVFNERAKAVIKVWTDAGMPAKWRTGFVPLQDLTVIAADPGFDEPSKQAFLQGYYKMATGLLLPPPPGVIRFPDGSSMKLTLQNEEDAFAAIYKGECPAVENCRTLTITNVELSSVKFLTSRGLASVPAWAFTIDGLNAPIYRVAVPPALVSELPPGPRADWPNVPNLRSAQDLISVRGMTIKFRLGVGACDQKIKPYVYETDNAIAIGGTASTTGEVCTAILKLQPETVTLARPAGSRAILDAVSGSPLIIARYP